MFLDEDVTETEMAKRVVSTAVEMFGRLDGLVNNAYISRQKPFLELKEADSDLPFNTGFRATRQFMLTAHDELADTKGAELNFASG